MKEETSDDDRGKKKMEEDDPIELELVVVDSSYDEEEEVTLQGQTKMIMDTDGVEGDNDDPLSSTPSSSQNRKTRMIVFGGGFIVLLFLIVCCFLVVKHQDDGGTLTYVGGHMSPDPNTFAEFGGKDTPTCLEVTVASCATSSGSNNHHQVPKLPPVLPFTLDQQTLCLHAFLTNGYPSYWYLVNDNDETPFYRLWYDDNNNHQDCWRLHKYDNIHVFDDTLNDGEVHNNITTSWYKTKKPQQQHLNNNNNATHHFLPWEDNFDFSWLVWSEEMKEWVDGSGIVEISIHTCQEVTTSLATACFESQDDDYDLRYSFQTTPDVCFHKQTY